MHEMALCRNVADIVLEEASRANAVRVSGIYLTIGYGRDIVEDLFETLLAWMLRDTIAAEAKLHLTRVPFTVQCDDCGHVFHVDVHDRSTWHCPRCSSTCYELNSGMEFYVNDIEIIGKTDLPDITA